MRTVIGIDHRGARIFAHATGSEQVNRKSGFFYREQPLFRCAGGVQKFGGAVGEEFRGQQIVRMIFVREADSRKAVIVFQTRIERNVVGFERKRCGVGEQEHGAGVVVLQRLLIRRSPSRNVGGKSAQGECERLQVKTRVDATASVEAVLRMIS